MMFRKKMLISLIAALAVLMVANITQAAQPAGFDDNEIRIGQWGPQTGPAAPWGSVARGSKLLFDIVNEEGRHSRPEDQILHPGRHVQPRPDRRPW